MDIPNKPIYPLDQLSENEIDQGYCKSHIGLTKREYFAGLAIQGLVASDDKGGAKSTHMLVNSAVEVADALLKELEK